MKLYITLIIFLLLQGSFDSNAQSQTQWRGLDRSGYYPAEKSYEQWPEGGPELLVHVENLPESYSSVVVKDDVLYTTGIKEGDEILTALRPDGSILWSTVFGRSWDKSYRPARCTPTIEENRAYLISGGGSLACVDLLDGKLRWSLEGHSTFGARTGNWGTAESPLIVGERMIYTPCGDQTTMVAVSKHDGSILWTSESLGDQSGYVSPVLFSSGDLKLIITVTGNYVIGVNALDGEIFWKLDYGSLEDGMMGADINPVTPLIKGNEIFVTSGYNHVGVMLRMASDCRSVEVKWISEDLDVHHGGVVEVDGYIYGSNYTSIKKGNWLCVDWDSGELKYEQEWQTKGQIITSGGMLFCYDERRGNMAMLEATPSGFLPLSEFTVLYGNGPHWSHPSIYEGKLYLRHGTSLLVYRL